MALPRAARLTLLAGLVTLLAAWSAPARDFTDATGRVVAVPDAPARVFAAGPPASVLKPEAMIGWSRAPREGDRSYLLPEVRDRPELGRLTGRGGTVDLEVPLAADPDLVFDFGAVSGICRSLAEGVQAQTGLPYALVDGSFEATPAALREMGALLGVPERGERLAAYAEETFAELDRTLARVPEGQGRRVHLARGPEGLESAAPPRRTPRSSRVGAVNLVESDSSGLVTVSPEQVLAWAPDVIVTDAPGFGASVGERPRWAGAPAVRDGRVRLVPSEPFASRTVHPRWTG